MDCVDCIEVGPTDSQMAMSGLYTEIYEIADRISAERGMCVPAGAEQRLWVAIDRLKASGIPAEDIELAEQISVTVHSLQAVLRSPPQSRAFRPTSLAIRTGTLAKAWLGRLPIEMGRC